METNKLLEKAWEQGEQSFELKFRIFLLKIQNDSSFINKEYAEQASIAEKMLDDFKKSNPEP